MFRSILEQHAETVHKHNNCEKYQTRIVVPKNIVIKCPQCKDILYERSYQRNLKVCPRCEYHFKLTAYERIEMLVDLGSFVEMDKTIASADPLHFIHQDQVYAEKVAKEQQKLDFNESVIVGSATIENRPLALAIMDFRFIGGSMGAAVGEKITRAIELGIKRHIPVLIASASGGARMQEGVYSLMQMAKTSMALAKLAEAALPLFCLLTDPTTGGVTASFASLGDVIVAEPGTLVCFAGPRVIEQFMHIHLPKDAVTAEFAFEHGLIDAVAPRQHLRQIVARFLHLSARANVWSKQRRLREQ